MIQFLTLEEILAIHESVIERFGGQQGIRDLGLLLSVIHRPQTGYYNDLAEMGTALFESLIVNHPFVDGNKLAAFFGTDVFLRLNGYQLEVKSNEAFQFLVGLIHSHTCDFDHLLPWIQKSVVSIHLPRTNFH